MGSVGWKIYLRRIYFLSKFCLLENDKKKKKKKVLLGLKLISSTVPKNMHIMKLRKSRKLKNMILHINFASLVFFRVLFPIF